MEGKKKQIVQEKPTSSASTFPTIPILAAGGNTARPSSFMSPSSLRLPRSPTSFNYFGPKPYFMNKTAAGPTTPGASSSGTTPAAGGFFPRSDPYFMNKAASGTSSSGTTPTVGGFFPRPEPYFMNKAAAGPTTPGTSSNGTTPAAGSFFPMFEPYFMNKAAAGPTTPGTNSSGTTPAAGGFIPTSEPFSMRGEKDKMDQNPLLPSSQNLTIGNSAKTEVAIPFKGCGGRKPDPNMESRKLKRIMSNRLSAQKSRIRKLQHLYDMEKKAESLQTLVHVLSSQVQLQKDKQFLMTIEKRQLQNRITACANRKLIVDGEIEARTEEINRLRELHMAQQNQQMQPQTMSHSGHGQTTEQMMDPSLNHYGTEQPMMDPSLNHYVESDQVDAGDEYMPEISMLDNLHLHQESPGNNIMVPGWEADEGQLTNVGLGQPGVEQQENPYLNQQPEQNQIGSFNSSMGELEQIFNFNPQNGVNSSNGFI